MRRLQVVTVPDGDVLDVVTLDDVGAVQHSTGAAADMLARHLTGDDLQAAFDRLAGWSNGYLHITEDEQEEVVAS